MLRSQRRMAAREDQSELVVPHGSFRLAVLSGRVVSCPSDCTKLFKQLPSPGRTAEVVDRTVAGGRNDPPCRVGWDAAGPPPVAGDDERVLDGVLGKADVAEDADQRRHRLPVRLAEHPLDTGGLATDGGGAGHA